jgi:hypothetical protein
MKPIIYNLKVWIKYTGFVLCLVLINNFVFAQDSTQAEETAPIVKKQSQLKILSQASG